MSTPALPLYCNWTAKTLSDLASIARLVSSVAVLVSLIHLALQVRQTERNQRAMMNQVVIPRTADILMHNSEPRQMQLRARMVAGETKYAGRFALSSQPSN